MITTAQLGAEGAASLISAGADFKLLARDVSALQSALGAICITLELIDPGASTADLIGALKKCGQLMASVLGAAQPLSKVPASA